METEGEGREGGRNQAQLVGWACGTMEGSKTRVVVQSRSPFILSGPGVAREETSFYASCFFLDLDEISNDSFVGAGEDFSGGWIFLSTQESALDSFTLARNNAIMCQFTFWPKN